MSTTGSTAESPKSNAVAITLGVLGALLAVIVAVALLAGGDDDAVDAAAADSARIPDSGTLRQVSFAEGAGPALARFEGAAPTDSAVGTAAPAITASYFDNTEVTIDMADGTPRLVMFFAHWCPHCQAEVTSLTERFNEQGLPDGVEILAISTAVDEGLPNFPPSGWFLAEQWPVPVLRDSAAGDLAAAYGLSGFPYTVAVGGDGTVLDRASGNLSEAQFDAMIDLAAG